jgi:hypothetical protein
MLTNKEQKERKSRLAAVAGTILFHGLLLIALLVLAMRTPLPQPEETGVEVKMEIKDEGVNSGSTNILSGLPSTGTELITEKPNGEKRKKKNTHPGKHIGLTKEVSTNNNPDEARKPDGATSTPFGTYVTDKGIAIFYFLGKREAQMILKPEFNATGPGKIIVSINVNREGKVTYASAGAKGTTLYGSKIRIQAEREARKALFAADPSAQETQRGIISYVFAGPE